MVRWMVRWCFRALVAWKPDLRFLQQLAVRRYSFEPYDLILFPQWGYTRLMILLTQS